MNNQEIAEKIRKELDEKDIKKNMLDKIEFIESLKYKLSPEDLSNLKILFDNIDEDARKESFVKGMDKSIVFLNQKIDYYKDILKNKTQSDVNYAFINKIIIKLEEIKLELGGLKWELI